MSYCLCITHDHRPSPSSEVKILSFQIVDIVLVIKGFSLLECVMIFSNYFLKINQYLCHHVCWAPSKLMIFFYGFFLLFTNKNFDSKDCIVAMPIVS